MCEVGILDDKIKEKYRHQIQESEIFLGSSSRAASRKTWSSLQQKKWLMRQAMCPTCDIKLNLQILTKEHIHPLCLGGAERDDNVIAMCHECNEARNNTMNDVLGGNNPKSLRNRWPANRSSVEEFVVWCHATVYGDFRTVRQLQHIEETFIRWRGLKSSKFLTKRFSNEEPKESIFKSVLFKTKSMLSKTKSVLSKPSSKVKIDCENCSKTLQLPKGYTGRFRCPSCNHINGDNPEVNLETVSKSSGIISSEVVSSSVTKESDSELKDSFRKYILQTLSENGRTNLSNLGNKDADSFVIKKGFTKFSELKVAMGYSLNKKMKDILADTCGESVIFTTEQIDDKPPKTYIELATETEVEPEQINEPEPNINVGTAFNLKLELWAQIEDAILTNKMEITDLDYVWRAKISPWSKTVGFLGVVELKKELGYSSKARVVDLVTELYGHKLHITRVGEKTQLLLNTND